MTLSHDLLGEAHCVLRPLILACSICRLWGPVRDHSAYNRSGTPIPWGPPWLCFSEMQWIGQLKRLSSVWPAAIKSSPTGYWDVAEGRLYLCLIQQFIVIFFPPSLLSSAALSLNSLQNVCSLIATVLGIWKDAYVSPREDPRMCIDSFLWRTASLPGWEDVDIRPVELRRAWLKLRLGGREDCVAVSLWLSWDLKLWSGSFRLSLMSAGLRDSFQFLSWHIVEKQSQQPYWF